VKIADFSVKRPVTIAMLMIAICLFGFVSLPLLKVDLLPELNLPVSVVVTNYEGAAPGEVEKRITQPIESVVGTVSNVKNIQSVSTTGSSQVIVQFDWGTDMDQATLDLREKIDLISGALPREANKPTVMKLDPNSAPIITLALSGNKDVVELKKTAEDLIKPRLERVAGVASVGITGGKERQVNITLNPNQLKDKGISIDLIQQSLMARNISGSAGSLTENGKNINISINGEFESIDDIKKTPIHIPSGGIIPLSDVATVEDGFKTVTQKTYVNGSPSVGINIVKASGANTVSVSNEVFKELEAIKSLLPDGVQVSTILDNSVFIKSSIKTVLVHAIEGALLAIIILYLFLHSFRSMLVVAIVIPISVIATFTLMYFTGQTINLISLAGLTLGLGSLVDFAVVVLESIFRKRQQGHDATIASIIGTKEVGTAVMASALAQIAVFLPIVFIEGLASELFAPLALTVVFSHIAALVAAITLVPMMSSKLLRNEIEEEEVFLQSEKKTPVVWFQKKFYLLKEKYRELISWALQHPKKVVWTTVILLGVSVVLYFTPLVNKELMPDMDQGTISISVQLPEGSTLAQTEKITSQVEEIINKIPEKQLIYTSTGNASALGTMSVAMDRATIQLKLVPLSERSRSTDEVVEDIRAKLKDITGAEIVVSSVDATNTGASAIDISITGENLATLSDISSVVTELVSEVEGTRNVTSSLESVTQEYEVKVNNLMAAQYGLTTNQIISAIRVAFEGQVVTQYHTGEDQINIRLQYPADFRTNKNNLIDLVITTPTGGKIPVSMVAEITKSPVPQQIMRNNQAREVKITGDVSGRNLTVVTSEIKQKLEGLKLPDGYFVKIGGETEEMAESFVSLGLAILLAIVLVYMVMASQFESLFHPFIIMFSIPPTFIGVVLGLILTRQSLSVYALMGYIMLIGIVVNNAIVLIDYINTLRREGMERTEAILKAGPIRLRPILMTTLTTVLAIIPLAFGGGEGNEGMAPLAIVVAFGLTFSTLITLVLVPVVYTLFEDWMIKRKNRRLERKRRKEPLLGEQ